MMSYQSVINQQIVVLDSILLIYNNYQRITIDTLKNLKKTRIQNKSEILTVT